MLKVCTALDISEVISGYEKSVVMIIVYNSRGVAKSQGSGCFINERGAVITNAHVVDSASTIKVQISDTLSFNATILLTDSLKDLALIKIETDSTISRPFILSKISQYKTGQHVIAIGNPLGLEKTVSDGIISRIRTTEEGVEYIQTTVPISPGSSGGVLLNDRGELIGITTLSLTTGQNINFAVGASSIRNFVDEYNAKYNDVLIKDHKQPVRGKSHKNVLIKIAGILFSASAWLLHGGYIWVLIPIVSMFIYLFIGRRLKYKKELKALDREISQPKIFKKALSINKTKKVAVISFGTIVALLIVFCAFTIVVNSLVNKYVNAGGEYYKNKDNYNAINSLNNAIKLNKNCYRAYYLRSKVIFDNIDTSYGYYHKVSEDSFLKVCKSAMTDLDKCISLNPFDTLALRDRCKIRYYIDDCRGVLEDANLLIKINPFTVVAYERKAYVLEKMNDFDGAIACYTKIIEICPTNSNAFIARGKLYVDPKEYLKLAEADFRAAINNDPKNVEARLEMGDLYIKMGLYYNALSYYKDVIPLICREKTTKATKEYYMNQVRDGILICRVHIKYNID